MSSLRRRDTKPELELRRLLFAAGLRYRVNYPVPGQKRRTIDIAFPGRRLAIFVDGCFWHGCPDHGTAPRANDTWWQRKIQANQARDRDTERVLDELGWTTIRVWEHDRPAAAADLVTSALRRRGPDKPHGATRSPSLPDGCAGSGR